LVPIFADLDTRKRIGNPYLKPEIHLGALGFYRRQYGVDRLGSRVQLASAFVEFGEQTGKFDVGHSDSSKAFRPVPRKLQSRRKTNEARHAAALASAFGDHSTISRVTLRFFRAATALRIVRIDFAVWPCLPITLPKSSFAARNSSSVAASPRVSVTSTASGLLTSCCAKNRTSSFMAGSVEEVEVKFLQAAMTEPSLNLVLWIRAKIRTVHLELISMSRLRRLAVDRSGAHPRAGWRR